jgi:hypothetical protein
MMIDKLKEAFALTAARPEQEQQALAELLFGELQTSKRWDELFADLRSDALLERMATEALAEDDAIRHPTYGQEKRSRGAASFSPTPEYPCGQGACVSK